VLQEICRTPIRVNDVGLLSLPSRECEEQVINFLIGLAMTESGLSIKIAMTNIPKLQGQGENFRYSSNGHGFLALVSDARHGAPHIQLPPLVPVVYPGSTGYAVLLRRVNVGNL
jgi:hypothetical protein